MSWTESKGTVQTRSSLTNTKIPIARESGAVVLSASLVGEVELLKCKMKETHSTKQHNTPQHAAARPTPPSSILFLFLFSLSHFPFRKTKNEIHH